MGEATKIQWTDHTFNPVIGCQRVAAGRQNCFAEAFAKRTGMAKWGPQGTRVKTSEANWLKPLKWNRDAEKAGERRRVFCASLSDVFEEWDGPILDHHGHPLLKCDYCGKYWPENDDSLSGSCDCGRFMPRMDNATLADIRRDLFALVDETNLDWQLLTKRPENIRRMWISRVELGTDLDEIEYRHNVWPGTSIATQGDADRNAPLLLGCRDLARVLFVSAEPLIAEIDLHHVGPTGWDVLHGWKPAHGEYPEGANTSRIDWIIAGAESGPRRRPMKVEWAESLAAQCREAGVPFFMKQMEIGGKITSDIDRFPKSLQIREFPCTINGRVSHEPEEWPESLRVREFPTAERNSA